MSTEGAGLKASSGGGYACRPENPLEQIEWKCPVCSLFLKEPHLTTCCEKDVCKPCVDIALQEKRPCPSCSKEEISVVRNKSLQKMLEGQMVLCGIKEGGCKWTGKLDAFLKHFEECGWVEVVCRHPGCSASVTRREVSEHEFLCERRPYKCNHCENYDGTYTEVANQHWLVCSKYPLSCPNECGKVLERQRLQNHLDADCPNTVVDCEFGYAGCKARLPLNGMPAHQSADVLAHLSMVAKMSRELLAEKNNMAERVAKLQAKVDEQVTMAKPSTGEETMVGGNKGGVDGNPKQSKALLTSRTPMCLPQLRTENAEVDRLRKYVKGLTKLLHTVEGMPPVVPLSVTCSKTSSCTTKKLLKEAIFYSGYGGYKMKLEVFAHDINIGLEGFKSNFYIHVRVINGEFDECLLQPFSGAVSVRIGSGQPLEIRPLLENEAGSNTPTLSEKYSANRVLELKMDVIFTSDSK